MSQEVGGGNPAVINPGQRPILAVNQLKKSFDIKASNGKKGKLLAVDHVTFTIFEGETFSLVGESGCGKSTLGRTILGLYDADKGSEILIDDRDVTRMSTKERKQLTKEAQLIFQDPSACLNPRRTVQQILMEPFKIHKIKTTKEHLENLLERVGLPKRFLSRYPHEMSGGQKQRVGIARALALEPKVIICDEPVSALDVSVQAQVINLLEDLQDELDLTYLFISHDLSVVHHISDRIAVMYLGRIIELTTRDQLYDHAKHPYTQALLSSIPDVSGEKREKIILTGDVPSPSDPPSGCTFHTRCPFVMDTCKVERPLFEEVEEHHYVACHLYTKK